MLDAGQLGKTEPSGEPGTAAKNGGEPSDIGSWETCQWMVNRRGCSVSFNRPTEAVGAAPRSSASEGRNTRACLRSI